MPAASLHLRYTLAILDLLPPGRLTREPGSNLYQLAEGLAVELARVDERTADGLREMVPWHAVEMLPDWEALLGLAAGVATVDERQAAVRARIQGDGPPTRPGFETIAASLGYTLTWLRDEPFACGVARIGGRIGGERRIFTWEAGYQVGGANDALLEHLLLAYAGTHAGGRLVLSPYDNEATFRGGAAQLVGAGPYTGWANAGDVSPLPSGLTGSAGVGLVNALAAADFDGVSDSIFTSDMWDAYAGSATKYGAFVIEADAAAGMTAILGGGFSWVIGIIDPGTGPSLVAYVADGGPGIFTPGVPMSLGTTYVVELLHANGWLVLRVYDAINGHRTTSIPAGPTDTSGASALAAGFGFNGRIAHVETYGARGAVPTKAHRDALAVELATRFT